MRYGLLGVLGVNGGEWSTSFVLSRHGSVLSGAAIGCP